MTLKFAVVAVKDNQAEGFSPIYIERNVSIAIRNFSDACQNKESQYNKHPKDFVLCLMGEYEPESGIIKPYIYTKDNHIIDESKVIATADEFVTKTENKIFPIKEG